MPRADSTASRNAPVQRGVIAQYASAHRRVQTVPPVDFEQFRKDVEL
jgi:hypothetical protein